jgi:predicted DNA-binding transcriptional regulator AlpA
MTNENGNARRLRTKREVASRLHTTTRTIDRLRKAGRFPPPIQISDRGLRWDDEVIDRFLADRTGR